MTASSCRMTGPHRLAHLGPDEGDLAPGHVHYHPRGLEVGHDRAAMFFQYSFAIRGNVNSSERLSAVLADERDAADVAVEEEPYLGARRP